MTREVLIYTTKSPKRIKASTDLAAKFLAKTRNCEAVNITLRQISTPKTVPRVIGKDGITRIDWHWIRGKFGTPGFNRIGFHFTRLERKRFKLPTDIGGSSNTLDDGVGYFYMCADWGKKASHYPFTNLTRLLVHEVLHIDVEAIGAQRDSVHIWDYEKHAIHELPGLLSFPVIHKTNSMLIPLEAKYWNAITQGFGVPNRHYKSGIHPGVDFKCPVGTLLRAPWDLEIYQRFSMHASLGNAVYCRFFWKGKPYWMRLLHGSWTAGLGMYKKGDLIFKTGNTGDSTGPHLHLDLWNVAINSDLIKKEEGVRTYMLDPLAFFNAHANLG